jgi:rhodanese-related sulfurtransferase
MDGIPWHAACRIERNIMPVEIGRDDVQRLLAAGAQLVEVLPREEFEAVHLPGALNMPLKELNRESATRLDRNRAVIVYCHDTQ